MFLVIFGCSTLLNTILEMLEAKIICHRFVNDLEL